MIVMIAIACRGTLSAAIAFPVSIAMLVKSFLQKWR